MIHISHTYITRWLLNYDIYANNFRISYHMFILFYILLSFTAYFFLLGKDEAHHFIRYKQQRYKSFRVQILLRQYPSCMRTILVNKQLPMPSGISWIDISPLWIHMSIRNTWWIVIDNTITKLHKIYIIYIALAI